MLSPSSETPYIYTGTALVANISYKYTRVINNNIVDRELFSRWPVQIDTANEFYNRSINSCRLPAYPQLYPPLSSIDRINTGIHQDDQILSFFFNGDEAGTVNMHSHAFDKDIK
jgi:hypothetical protein